MTYAKAAKDAEIQSLQDEIVDLKESLRRVGKALEPVKSESCQGHYSTMITILIKEVESLRKDVLANAKDAERYRLLKTDERFCAAKWNAFGEEWYYVSEHILDDALCEKINNDPCNS